MKAEYRQEPTVGDRVTEHAYDALGGVGRLRRLWPWLGDARLPGRPGIHLLLERRMSETDEDAENAAVRRDRAAKHEALRTGRTPGGPSPSPVRLGPVRARATIAGQLRSVGGRLGATLPARLADPTLRRPRTGCTWCAGTGVTQRPTDWAWPWPARPPSCGMCGGHGTLCTVCHAIGPCFCDLADVVVDACLDAIAAALPRQDNPAAAAAAAGGLNAAADLACATLGLRDVDMRVIKAPCPACGRRDLWADVASPVRAEWSVVCRSPLCQCDGPGCPCGRPVRWAGRRHRWPSTEFGALADRLGTTLPL